MTHGIGTCFNCLELYGSKNSKSIYVYNANDNATGHKGVIHGGFTGMMLDQGLASVYGYVILTAR